MVSASPCSRGRAWGTEAYWLSPSPCAGCMVRQAVNLALGVLVAWLSIPVVLNLLSPKQVMNSSFNPLRIVNTYGAFGRYQHSWDPVSATSLAQVWSPCPPCGHMDPKAPEEGLALTSQTGAPGLGQSLGSAFCPLGATVTL